jgi:hypothetical protein
MTINMRKEKFKISLERVVQAAKELALEQGGHTPTVMIEGSREIVALPIEHLEDSPEERVNQMYQLGFLLASFAIVGVLKQVFFIAEGWMNVTQDGKQPEIRPSQDPQRTEVLLISQLNVINDLAKVVLLEMKRDMNGTLYALENVDGRLPEPESSVKSPLLEAFAIGFLGFAQDTKH